MEYIKAGTVRADGKQDDPSYLVLLRPEDLR